MTIVFIYPMNFDIIGNTVFINRTNHYESKEVLMNYGVKATKKRIRAANFLKKKYANRLFRPSSRLPLFLFCFSA